MAITSTGLQLEPAAVVTRVNPGSPVTIHRKAHATKHVMTAESYSPPILRGVANSITLWITGDAQDIFRLEMCYEPVFDANDEFDPDNSYWAFVGQEVTITAEKPTVGQTLDDMAYAVRVARVEASIPTAGDFTVHAWYLRG